MFRYIAKIPIVKKYSYNTQRGKGLHLRSVSYLM